MCVASSALAFLPLTPSSEVRRSGQKTSDVRASGSSSSGDRCCIERLKGCRQDSLLLLSFEREILTRFANTVYFEVAIKVQTNRSTAGRHLTNRCAILFRPSPATDHGRLAAEVSYKYPSYQPLLSRNSSGFISRYSSERTTRWHSRKPGDGLAKSKPRSVQG